MKEYQSKKEYDAQRVFLFAELYQYGKNMSVKDFERVCRKLHCAELKIYRLKGGKK